MHPKKLRSKTKISYRKWQDIYNFLVKVQNGSEWYVDKLKYHYSLEDWKRQIGLQKIWMIDINAFWPIYLFQYNDPVSLCFVIL